MDDVMMDGMGAAPEEYYQEEPERRVRYTKDTKIKRAAAFRFDNEDHTLGNLLRMQLLRDDTVLFAGYMMPHPLEKHMIIKIQTKDSTHPLKAIITACDDLQNETIALGNAFKASIAEYKQDNGMDQGHDYGF